MPAQELGPWKPLSPADLLPAMADVRSPWWLAGGWALDTFIGRVTRPHGDIDVQILRPDHQHVRAALGAWDLHAVDPPGRLRPWSVGEELPVEVHDIWCRQSPASAWALQLMVVDVECGDWVYRRDRRIRRPVDELSARPATAAVPVLSPDVQLLYKSKDVRPKDQQDFDVVRPALTTSQRGWLRDALTTTAPGHPWLAEI